MPKAAKTYRAPRQRTYDQRRGTRTERGYDNRWLRASAQYRKENPLCVMCEKQGRSEPAFCVDHVIPHRGDMVLFWDQDNWQSLCERHHNEKSSAEQRRGTSSRYVVCGLPGVGKSTYVNEHKQHGSIVWDYDVIATALCGATPHELPQDIIVHMLSMLDALIDSIAYAGCEREVWVICMRREPADAIAKRIDAEVIELQCDDSERIRRLSHR